MKRLLMWIRRRIPLFGLEPHKGIQQGKRTSDLITLGIKVLHIEATMNGLVEQLLEHGTDHGKGGDRIQRKATNVVTQRDLIN